jgi:hypothetical protein
VNLGWKLIDAEERNAENSASFQIAPRAEREGLAVGRLVKIGVFNPALKGPAPNGERFWVKIEAVLLGRYDGRIDNDLVLTCAHGLFCGCNIVFGPEHILQTEPPPPGARPPRQFQKTKDFLARLKAGLN